MTLRIIDNKRIDLTDAEWALYQEICLEQSPHREGEDMFVGLFETDERGIIVFLKPPTKKFSSMEVYMYLVGVMVHQHLGTACDQVDALAQRMLEKEIEYDERMRAKEVDFNKRLADKEAVINKKIEEAEKLLERNEKIIKEIDKKRREVNNTLSLGRIGRNRE